jgi:hypothetical protein
MQLTEQTLNVLKNYSTIHPNIVIEKGNVLKTVSPSKNILAVSTVTTTFPTKLGIYDLPEFLNAISMIDSPEFSFKEGESVIIKNADNTQSIEYFLSDETILTKPMRDIDMPETELEFELSDEQMGKIRRASSTFGSDTLVITPDNGELVLSVRNIEDKTSNSYSFRVSPSKCPENDFRYIFNIANFKFVSGDLNVLISSQLIGEFAVKGTESKYWVALEKRYSFKK